MLLIVVSSWEEVVVNFYSADGSVHSSFASVLCGISVSTASSSPGGSRAD